MNEIGRFDGSTTVTLIDCGIHFFVVEADGPWTMEIDLAPVAEGWQRPHSRRRVRRGGSTGVQAVSRGPLGLTRDFPACARNTATGRSYKITSKTRETKETSVATEGKKDLPYEVVI